MRAALSFLTPVPAGGGAPTGRALPWFPLVGALVGAAVGAAWWGAGEVAPPLVAAAVAVVVDLVLTGALHVDGMADTADGLLPHLDGPARRRAVMAAPDVGAFGVAAVSSTLLLRWAALASIDPDVAATAALWATSRGVMAVALLSVPYVGSGLGLAFLGGRREPVLLLTLLAAATLTLLASAPGAVAAGLGAGALAAAGVVSLARRRIGGVTGDVVGAAGLVAETVGLVVVTAVW